MRNSGPSVPPPPRPGARTLPPTVIVLPNGHSQSQCDDLRELQAHARRVGIESVNLASDDKLYMLRIRFKDRAQGRAFYSRRADAEWALDSFSGPEYRWPA